MTINTLPTAGLAVDTNTSPKPTSLRFAQTEGRPPRKMPLMRTYEVVHLTPSGDINDFQQIAPALPAFEDAFSTFARGTLIATTQGPVAIEDLLPGDMILNEDGDSQPLLWRGSMTMIPNVNANVNANTNANAIDREAGALTRISMDTFGLGRPMPDLVLGPHARIVHKIATIRRLTGHSSALIPARDFSDGVSINSITPMMPVQVYNIGLERQAKITANGVEMASQHPGAAQTMALRGEILNLYLSMFPHANSLEDFGPIAMPYLSLSDLEMIDAA